MYIIIQDMCFSVGLYQNHLFCIYTLYRLIFREYVFCNFDEIAFIAVNICCI